MYQIQIDLAQFQLVDKGGSFSLVIPTKVYTNTNPPLVFPKKGEAIHKPSIARQNSEDSDENAHENPPQPQINPSFINFSIGFKNGDNSDRQSIKNQFEKIQKRYQELLRSNINDASSQAQADLIGLKKEESVENKENDKEKEKKSQTESLQDRPRGTHVGIPSSNTNNIFSNRLSNNSSGQQAQSPNPFGKNTFTPSVQAGNSSISAKNPFTSQFNSNSLFNSGSTLQKPISLAQNNAFNAQNPASLYSQSQSGQSSSLFDNGASNNRSSRANSRGRRGPSFA